MTDEIPAGQYSPDNCETWSACSRQCTGLVLITLLRNIAVEKIYPWLRKKSPAQKVDSISARELWTVAAGTYRSTPYDLSDADQAKQFPVDIPCEIRKRVPRAELVARLFLLRHRGAMKHKEACERSSDDRVTLSLLDARNDEGFEK